MSKFTEKPYIEKVLSELSGENKAKLLNLINGKNAEGTADVSYTLCESAEAMADLTAGVHAIAYRFSPAIVWKGYFVKTTNYKCFITYKNGIDLRLAFIYKNDGTSIIPMDKVTADSIRALLREDAYIDVSELPEAGTQVEANPELAGTENALTGIKIDDTKYTISGGLQYGYYYLINAELKWIYGGKNGELIPEGYEGIAIQFLDDGFYIVSYVDGAEISSTMISVGTVSVSDNEGINYSFIDASGVSKVQPQALNGLTHSFNELDPVIKQIIVDAFAEGGANGVACTQEQWNTIKALLDNSLYINYDGYLMIKTSTSGTNTYVFGGRDLTDNYGYSLYLHYNADTNQLDGQFNEL